MSDINWQPGQTLEMVEKAVILKAFRFFQGNKTQTSIALGISVRTLDTKLSLYSGVKTDAAVSNAETGTQMEPTPGNTTQHAMPVQERKEVQGVPPRLAASGGQRRGR